MDPLMAIASKMIATETRRVEVAAHNAANAATPGYHSQRAFQDALIDGSAHRTDATRLVRVVSDLSPGKLVHTGNPSDIAMDGEGYLVLSTDQGPGYIRGGSLRRDENGHLVAAQGWPLLAADGGPVIVDSDDEWRIDASGRVTSHGSLMGELKIVRFDQSTALAPDDRGVFYADASANYTEATPHIRQGFLESSNVVMAKDMIGIMESMRRVESGQKVIHAYDDMMGSVLQRLGDM